MIDKRIGVRRVRKLRQELERDGLVRWSGECRDGYKVYVVTPLGAQWLDQLNADDDPADGVES
jgi:hypothetical protein